jgi:hypothetical protein
MPGQCSYFRCPMRCDARRPLQTAHDCVHCPLLRINGGMIIDEFGCNSEEKTKGERKAKTCQKENKEVNEWTERAVTLCILAFRLLANKYIASTSERHIRFNLFSFLSFLPSVLSSSITLPSLLYFRLLCHLLLTPRRMDPVSA